MLRSVFITIFSTEKVLCSLFSDVVSFHNCQNVSFKLSGSGIRDLKVMKERWYSCQGSRLCMLSTAFNWSKITFGAINLIFQIRAGWTDFRALPSLSRYSHLIIHIFAYVSVKSKLQHAPPGNSPGIWLFWKLLFKFPPTRAKMPFKCPTLGSIQVIKCPDPGDISQAQKWQKDGGNTFSCRTKYL